MKTLNHWMYLILYLTSKYTSYWIVNLTEYE